MIANGENTGRNFVNDFTFEYAKQRIAGKKNETIDEYRLFNNLLSSQPMAFNLFCPLIQMLKEGKEELATRIVQSTFPDFNIGQVTEIELEYLHTKVENYLNDRTAMDAIIRYTATVRHILTSKRLSSKNLVSLSLSQRRLCSMTRRVSVRFIGTSYSLSATASRSQPMSAILLSSVPKTIRQLRKKSDPFNKN